MDRRLLRLFIVGCCVAYTVSECPAIKMEPSTVVVRFGDRVSVNCTVPDNDGIGWEASEGSVDMKTDVEVIPWSVESLEEWDIRPKCFALFDKVGGPPLQCDERLNITVYKPPDNVSISVVDHTGPMLEGEQYQLQCEVQNVAPVQYLAVKWYEGATLVSETLYNNLTKTPVNVSSTFPITPTGADDGVQYSCVAELDLGPEGPQPPLEVKSDHPVRMIVFYPPSHSLDAETLEVTEGEQVVLDCYAKGNPPPAYSWASPLNDGEEEKTSQKLVTSTSLSPGEHVYTCTATSVEGQSRKTFTVKIHPKGDKTVLGTVIGVGVAFAVLLIVGYVYQRRRTGGNSII